MPEARNNVSRFVLACESLRIIFLSDVKKFIVPYFSIVEKVLPFKKKEISSRCTEMKTFNYTKLSKVKLELSIIRVLILR